MVKNRLSSEWRTALESFYNIFIAEISTRGCSSIFLEGWGLSVASFFFLLLTPHQVVIVLRKIIPFVQSFLFSAHRDLTSADRPRSPS